MKKEARVYRLSTEDKSGIELVVSNHTLITVGGYPRDVVYKDKNLEDLPLIPGLRLIKTNKELFTEGMSQHHCVYSNYKNRVKNNDYFVLAYEGKERSTIGITVYAPFDKTNKDFVAVINQMYKAYNDPVCDEDRRTIEKWLESEKVQNFFLDNCLVKSEQKRSFNFAGNNPIVIPENINLFL